MSSIQPFNLLPDFPFFRRSMSCVACMNFAIRDGEYTWHSEIKEKLVFPFVFPSFFVARRVRRLFYKNFAIEMAKL